MNKMVEELHHKFYDLSAEICDKFLDLWDDPDSVKFEGSFWMDGSECFPKSCQFFHSVVRVLVYEDVGGEVMIKPINEFTTAEMLDVMTCLK